MNRGDTARHAIHDITADALFEMPDDGLDRPPVTLQETGWLSGGDLLPEFTCQLATFFPIVP